MLHSHTCVDLIQRREKTEFISIIYNFKKVSSLPGNNALSSSLSGTYFFLELLELLEFFGLFGASALSVVSIFTNVQTMRYIKKDDALIMYGQGIQCSEIYSDYHQNNSNCFQNVYDVNLRKN